MGFKWTKPPEKVFPELATAYKVNIDAAIGLLAQSYAPQIEAWMKQNAIWTDRTGNARQTLASEVEEMVNQVTIAFGHGVAYGKWLELANSGRYAIVSPALDYFAPKIWADVKRILN